MSTIRRTLGTGTIVLGAATALALTPALAAAAHVGASASSTAAGSSSVVTFAVPHGCDGAPTTGLEIRIPETITSVTPTVKAGWAVEKHTVELDEPLEGSHGETITQRVDRVVYTSLGDGLADGYRDTFDVQVRLPNGEAGDIVEFPVVQTCPDGVAEWVGDDTPTVVLTAADADTGHGHGGGANDHETDGHADSSDDAASDAPSATAETDMLARGLGVAGLALGAAALVVAIARRGRGADSGTDGGTR